MAKTKETRNKAAMWLAIVGGILLLISGLTGAAAWTAIRDFVVDNVSDDENVYLVFNVLIIIAALGGLACIIGGLLIGRDHVRTGSFLVSLGAGMGLIGLLINVAIAVYQGDFSVYMFAGIGAMGVLLAVMAQVVGKKQGLTGGKKK